MPSATLDGHGIPAVSSCSSFLHDVLERAEKAKSTASIEPPLTKAELGDVSAQLSALFDEVLKPSESDDAEQGKARRFAIFETAARELFSHLIAITPIESPQFIKVWNLLDLLSILSDDFCCDPALPLWLVEELLDSQTISGCRRIFDFLESRRERITARQFKQKQLVILRSCNELLRRLSRAEDTAFCGRVFIFMFQSFPLGDKSSVNLRGEYHVENVTTFDKPEPKEGEPAVEAMEVDSEAVTKEREQKQSLKAVTFDSRKTGGGGGEPLNADELYPVFWSLQDSFSQPKKLFDAAYFARFRGAMETTMTAFRALQAENSRQSKTTEEARRNLKRKREEGDEDLANAFNPKYLTSRDLFELEIGDLSFRRHVLVQALIIMDFLLSLSAKAKEKLATTKPHNKSVMYLEQRLTDEETKWATDMKRSIADYLKQGFEGPYFYRMVETVLSRDKNWVRWKVENCPPINLPTVSPELFLEAKQTAQRTTTSKRLRPAPMGSLNLDFLKDTDPEAAMERLKDRERYAVPELESFKRKIADDDFEIDMPTNNQTKAAAVEGKASKSWRALRIAAQNKLAAFDKLDDPEKIDAIFETQVDEEEQEADEVVDVEMPADKRLVVVAGLPGSGKSAIVGALMEKRPDVFGKVVRHTTREAKVGEVEGEDFHFVSTEAFNVMVSNDQFLEFGGEGEQYGTTRRSIEGVAPKVPVLEAPLESVQQIKDMAFSARFVTVKSPLELYEQRLNGLGTYSEEAISSLLEKAAMDVEGSDVVIVNGDAQPDATLLEEFIYGKETQQENEAPEVNGQEKPEEGADQEMKDESVVEERKEEDETGVVQETDEKEVVQEMEEEGGAQENVEEASANV
ncbi:related to nuclear matrix protein p84 [Cephalotrichum gorgonifer]|uniref:Related to nuclear matrix protein p84 n=1 Tax=Cephalotrichum gorgonifer TaxID=2041049 RepID=A0AAE8MUZ1_9PEZI|nr:related to nuclear matrix protein p84 [Cephalotrichum gorgonifer]